MNARLALPAMALGLLVLASQGAEAGPGDIIYDNSQSEGEAINIDGLLFDVETPVTFVDWSISIGGTVESFTFGYGTGEAGPVDVTILFFEGTNEMTDGSLIAQFPLTLPGSSDPPNVEQSTFDVDVPVISYFDLPGGETFGWGMQVSDDTTGPIYATGDPFASPHYRVVPSNINLSIVGESNQFQLEVRGTPLGGGIAYVSATATGPGALNDDTNPFPTIQAALAAGAVELRIEPGAYDGAVLVAFLDREVRTWNGMAGASKELDVPGPVVINGATTLAADLVIGVGFLFDDVTLTLEADVLLHGDAGQNDSGILTLEKGIIDTNDEFKWVINNPDFEMDLGGRNNAAEGKGVVELGSRDSYINGEVERTVEFGNATGGVITGGYLFPVGTKSDPDKGEPPFVDYFRPLILQFPADLGGSSRALVDYREDLTNEDVDFPDEGLVVNDEGGGMLTLDVLSNQFWQLEFDKIPSFDPNIRVEADELPNVFEIKALRLIQWDCDGTNPRLAGIYDLNGDQDEEPSAVVNDFIEGVPNITQTNVEVTECNIIGIASNSSINAIDEPESAGESLIWGDHNCSGSAGPVDSLLTLRFDAALNTNTNECPDFGQVVEVAFASPHPWGDVDCSGAVTPVDSLKLLRFDAGLGVAQEASCPVMGSEVTITEL